MIYENCRALAVRLKSKQIAVFVFVLLAHLSCDGNKSAVGPERAVGVIAVDLMLPGSGDTALEAAAKVHKSVLTQGRFRISGEGMTPIDTTVTAQNNRLVGRLDGIPVGQRTVELSLLDADATLLWNASTTVVVSANAQATATLVLERSGDLAPAGTIRLSGPKAQVDTPFGVAAEVSDLHDADETLEVRWDFAYDGEDFAETGWLSAKTAEHTYGGAGIFTVGMQVRDRSGKTATYTETVEVELDAQVVVFADAGLEAVLRQAVGKQTGDLLVSDVSGLTELIASEKGISRLDGLEHLTALTSLDLAMNQISDLGPLARLTRLLVLGLSQNQISDLAPLSGLVQLIDMSLSNNRISDLSPLAGLAQLIDLDLSGNRLSDLSSLAGLDRLVELDLDSNEITDIEPLLHLDRLGTVDLQFNPPLNAAAYGSHIPALVDKGVEVEFNALPVAAAGPDQQVEPGKTVQLDGSGSTDADGDELGYTWTQTGGPEVALSDVAVARPTFNPLLSGDYIFALVVSDDFAESAADTVVVTTLNRTPVADAGADQGVEVGAEVRLDGGASADADGDGLIYAWTQVAGPDVSLSDATAAQPSFQATVAGTYTFTLVVNDGKVSSPVDAVNVTAAVGNLAPIADAGSDFQVQFGATVQLDGSGSNDPEGVELTYRWTAPEGIGLSSSTVVSPSFDAATAGTFSFVLVVNDGQADGVPDTAVVTVQKNTLPAVVVSSPATGGSLREGRTVIFKGTATDAEDGALGGGALQWTSDIDGPLGTGNEVEIADLSPGDHTISLVAVDSQLDFGTASITLVIRANSAPVANAGSDRQVETGDSVLLNGIASSDPDDDELTYQWNQTGGPAVELSNSAAVRPAFTPQEVGVYRFVLVVGDGLAQSAADEVVVNVDMVIVFADANLEAAVRQELGNASGDILVSQARTLDGLVAANAGIGRLEGLEYFTGLEFLDLRTNNISDIAPLAGLAQLDWLGLDHNPIQDFGPLAGLTRLTTLYMVNNGFSDISVLEGLTRLEILWVAANGVEDISVLAGLIQLGELILFENSIADLSPLLDNAGLGSGDRIDLSSNLLGDTAINEQIPTLEARGAEVFFSVRQPVLGDELRVDLPGGVSMDFVWIEAGTFTMGSPDSEEGRRPAGEGPQHEVTLTQGYWLGKYEITQEQWQAVMGTRPWVGHDFAVPSVASHPVVYVSWHDMQEFVSVLNSAAGQTLFRLPTEAEWEYACRAGTTTPWSFGDDGNLAGDYAWYGPNAFQVGESWGHPVGTKLPNPWGLHDMHGNVLEWVQDPYSDRYYSQSPSIDPQGPDEGDFGLHTGRGGDFFNSATLIRSAGRGLLDPGFIGSSHGARLLRVQ